jgi:predicted nucleic acid-binding protein
VRVLVDTTVWSLALRRRRRALHRDGLRLVREFESLVVEGRVLLAGPVRQEILTGVRDASAFERLREHLSHFDDVALRTEDYETAADFANRCLAAGVAVTSTDLLLCAIAARRSASVFTTDPDFTAYAEALPVKLHVARSTEAR